MQIIVFTALFITGIQVGIFAGFFVYLIQVKKELKSQGENIKKAFEHFLRQESDLKGQQAQVAEIQTKITKMILKA